VIKFVEFDRTESFAGWFVSIFQSPDNGLWFLLVLFEISVVVALAAWLASVVRPVFRAAQRSADRDTVLIACLTLSCIFFWPIRYVVPALGMAIYFVKYVCLGAVYKMVFPRGLPIASTLVAGAVFASLWPFWVWNGSPAIDWHPAFIDERIIAAVFDFAVALSGTLVTVEMCRLASRYAPSVAVRPVAFCGKRTLDIYALHYRFLGFAPWVIAPIALSLLASLVLRQLPFGGLVLFGDGQSRPIWWSAVVTRAADWGILRKRENNVR
jgi:hypothetical protein